MPTSPPPCIRRDCSTSGCPEEIKQEIVQKVAYAAKRIQFKVSSAEFVVSSQLKSPMGGNAVAFKTRAEAEKKASEIDGSKVTNWATLYNILIK